jgi:hypothetical protein
MIQVMFRDRSRQHTFSVCFLTTHLRSYNPPLDVVSTRSPDALARPLSENIKPTFALVRELYDAQQSR